MSSDIEFSRMTCHVCKLPLAYIRSRDVVVCPGCLGWNRSAPMAQGAMLIAGADEPELRRQLGAALAEHRLKD
jgi:hypothetical protein